MSFLEENKELIPYVKALQVIAGQITGQYVDVSIHLPAVSIKPIDILEIISEVTGVAIENIYMGSRKQMCLMARQLAVYFIKENGAYTLMEIAAILNYKDHTSIMHSISKLRNMIITKDVLYYPYYKKLVNELMHLKMKPIKITFKREIGEGVIKLIECFVGKQYDSFDDKLVIAAMVEMKDRIYTRLGKIQEGYTLQLTAVQAIALHLFVTEFLTDLHLSLLSIELLKISNHIHQKYIQ